MNDETQMDIIKNFGMDADREASMITQVVLSVVRDRAISSLYGYFTYSQGQFPEISEVLKSPYSERAVSRLEDCAPGASNEPLYSGDGELLGQLSRLLLVCNERGVLKQYISKANEAISNLGIETAYLDDENYVGHLRNAVMHCKYEVDVNQDNPLLTKIVFLDTRKEHGKIRITGMMSFSSEQLNNVINILIYDICLKYLNENGWILPESN